MRAQSILSKTTGTTLLKASVLAGTSLGHWLWSGSVSAVLLAVLPYYLLVLAWQQIRFRVLLLATLTVLIWSDIDAWSSFERSSSSTAGVGLVMQVLLACGVVGAVVLVSHALRGPDREM